MLCFIFILMIIFTNPSDLLPESHTSRIRFADFYRELSSSHLCFSATQIPPIMSINVESNGNFSYSGLLVHLSDFLADLLNVRYSFVSTREDDEKEVGVNEASLNLILRHEVDVVTYASAMSLDRCTRFDCSFPVTFAANGLMVPWPEKEIDISAPIKPFQPMIWICLLITLIFITLTLAWIPAIYLKFVEGSNKDRPIQNVTAFNHSAIHVIAILTNHGSHQSRFKQLSYRIVIASWCLGAFIIVNFYSSTLTSYLMAPKFQPVAKSFEDLASGFPQNLKILTEKNGNLANGYFLCATSGTFKILGDSLRENPESLFTTRQNGADLMDTGRYAYAAMEQLLFNFLDTANKRAGYCRFTLSNTRLPIMDNVAVFFFPKDWRYTDAVNFKFQIGWDSGIINHWIKTYRPKIDKCLLGNYQKQLPKIRSLSLADLSGPFVILLLGLSISLLVFLLEILYFRIKIMKVLLRKRNNISSVANSLDQKNLQYFW